MNLYYNKFFWTEGVEPTRRRLSDSEEERRRRLRAREAVESGRIPAYQLYWTGQGLKMFSTRMGDGSFHPKEATHTRHPQLHPDPPARTPIPPSPHRIQLSTTMIYPSVVLSSPTEQRRRRSSGNTDTLRAGRWTGLKLWRCGRQRPRWPLRRRRPPRPPPLVDRAPPLPSPKRQSRSTTAGIRRFVGLT